MSWHLRKVEGQWEVWDENEKQDMRDLRFLPSRATVPSFFSTCEELVNWLHAEERKLSRKKALDLLAGRNYSTHLLHRKLITKGFSAKIAQETVEWAQQLGYVQDSEYLRSAIRQEQERGHGPMLVLWKLRAKGFSEQEIGQEMELSMTADQQKEMLRKLITKLRLSTAPLVRQKTIKALLRRGFTMETIRAVIREPIAKLFGA